MRARPFRQKVIGILGGASDVATAEYYRRINAASNARLGGWDMAETLIAGMNFGNIEAMVRSGDWPGIEAYMAGKADALAAGGADLLLCVSNTLHRPLSAVMEGRALPWIHIADPTGAAIRAAGLSRVALFGTRPAMEDPHLRARYESRFGLTVLTPDAGERAEIDRIIFDELVKGKVRAASKARYLAIFERLARDEGAEGLILGCTEIFTLIGEDDLPGRPVFDTARLHCEAAVAAALGGIGESAA